MGQRPSLNVIQGDWVAAPNWLDFPTTIEARSPFLGLDRCTLRISRADTTKAAGLRRRIPAYVLWSCLFGKPPPVPQVEGTDEELSRLLDAHACFRGIRRPCAEDETGEDIVAYILKPRWAFTYRAMPPILFAEKVEVPQDLVLVACAKLDNPSRQNGSVGVLTHWHFVNADKRNSMLPRDHKSRYSMRLW